MSFRLLCLGQWLGVALLSVGIGYEIIFRADFGYLVITSGSLVFCVFTKIRYYKPGKKFWQKLLHHL